MTPLQVMLIFGARGGGGVPGGKGETYIQGACIHSAPRGPSFPIFSYFQK